MTDKAVKVGDVVAWDEVPDGALILEKDGFYSQRMNGRGRVAALKGYEWRAWGDDYEWRPDSWKWPHRDYECYVEIIALNLTGNETADDLRALAEAFEREHPTRDA